MGVWPIYLSTYLSIYLSVYLSTTNDVSITRSKQSMGSMQCFSTGDDLVCTTIRSYFIKWSEIKELFLTSHIPQDTLCPISLSTLELARRSGYYVGNFFLQLGRHSGYYVVNFFLDLARRSWCYVGNFFVALAIHSWCFVLTLFLELARHS